VAEAAHLEVFDLAGRRVWGSDQAMAAAGMHSVAWGGVRDSGAPVWSGIYFVRLMAGGKSATAKLLVFR